MQTKPCIYKVNGRWYASIKIEGITLLIPGQPTIDSAWKTLQGRVSVRYGVELTASRVTREAPVTSRPAREAPADFKRYLIDQLVIYGIYQRAHENDPARALSDLVQWNVHVALDPAVSSDAVKLQNEAYRKAASLCLDKDYPFDIDILRNSTKSGVMAMMARRLGEEIKKCIVPLNER